MLYLAIIFHMHQPYYKNLLTQEADVPWVRLHGAKDYLDMVHILEKYPKIHQIFNFVPSLLEQVEDYSNNTIKDKFLEYTLKPADELTEVDKAFILDRFFSINPEKAISVSPRYYELYFNKLKKKAFTEQDFLDLQVWFNLAWIDPLFRRTIPELKNLVNKARFFDESDKQIVISAQLKILKEIIPAYKKSIGKEQVEVTITPYYHPILPLLFNSTIAREANTKVILPKINFSYPIDAQSQINMAVDFFKGRFEEPACGMWPSEEAVSEHILPYIINSGIKWIVADEAILFRSLGKKKRESRLLYQPHMLKRKEGECAIVFRDRNLSDLIGFTYHKMSAVNAVEDFINHLKNINQAFKKQDILVTIAMDGENAWEYYPNDGHDFLNLLYQRLSETDFVQTTTIAEYLKKFPVRSKIKRLSAGSWIYGEFGKWIGNPQKVKAWEYLAIARNEFEVMKNSLSADKLRLAWKQIYILEGSDWFWWYGEDPNGDFDKLYRMHMKNFYTIIGREPPQYLNHPI